MRKDKILGGAKKNKTKLGNTLNSQFSRQTDSLVWVGVKGR